MNDKHDGLRDVDIGWISEIMKTVEFKEAIAKKDNAAIEKLINEAKAEDELKEFLERCRKFTHANHNEVKCEYCCVRFRCYTNR